MKKTFRLLFLTAICFIPNVVFATDYLVCGDDKKIPLALATILSIVVTFVKIIIPVLLVIGGMISFFKATVSSKVDDELKKAKDKLINSFIAAIIIFFIVSITSAVVSFAVGKKTNVMSCVECLIKPDSCPHVDSDGYIICPGLFSDQDKYDENCRLKDAYKLNNDAYGDGSDDSRSSATGQYTTWRQASSQWGNRKYGGTNKKGKPITLANAGCNLTSIAIQIERSGVSTTISDFNPGTLFDYMKSRGYLSSNGTTRSYAAFSEVAPNFVYENVRILSGYNKQQIYDILSGLIKENKYPILHVKSGNNLPYSTSNHWVAVVGYTSDDIEIVDPASVACTRLFTCKPGRDRSHGYGVADKVAYWRVK